MSIMVQNSYNKINSNYYPNSTEIDAFRDVNVIEENSIFTPIQVLTSLCILTGVFQVC